MEIVIDLALYSPKNRGWRDRVSFRESLKNVVLQIINGRGNEKQIWMFFWEMLKNVYDHSNCEGVMRIEEATDNTGKTLIFFEIKNKKEEPVNLDLVLKNWIDKGPENYGMGIKGGYIRNLAEGLKVIEYKLEENKGFCHSGKIPLS